MTRVTDEMVRDWLIWARNHGEIVAYAVRNGRGRRIRVRLPAGVTRDGRPARVKESLFDITGHAAKDIVPSELMLTPREALVFAMGCAVARAARFGGIERDWTEDWTPAEKTAFAERWAAAREADVEDLRREAERRETERQERIAAYKQRKTGMPVQGQIGGPA